MEPKLILPNVITSVVNVISISSKERNRWAQKSHRRQDKAAFVRDCRILYMHLWVPFQKIVHADFLHRTCPEPSQTASNRRLLFPMAGSTCNVKPSSIVQLTFALYYALKQDPNNVDLRCDMQTVREQAFFEMCARQTHEMNARQKEKGIIRRKNRITPPIMLTPDVRAFHPP